MSSRSFGPFWPNLRHADPTAERTIHTLRSSNLPFYSAVWTAAKSCKGLLLFNKRFYWDTPPARSSNRAGKPRKKGALVDIVAEDGEEWIKVSTITETRLLFEKAKAGWEGAGSSSDTEGEEDGVVVNGSGATWTIRDHGGGSADDDDNDRVELLRMAQDLQKASKATRVRYRHPKVRFVLPKIHKGRIPAIDAILDDIRATGATVQCADDIPSVLQDDQAVPLHTETLLNSKTRPNPPQPALHLTFSRLLIDPFASFTPTINIDCTILLALVSDLSHEPITPELWFHRAVQRQIELEATQHLLPTSLWPAMANKELVCTATAANRMREIVALIGTPAERRRTDLLLGDDEYGGAGKSAEELRTAFAATSTHRVPEDWNLPVRVLAAEIRMENLPPVAEKVARRLTDINRSVFLFGWERGFTTVSSNRTVAKMIEGVVRGAAEGWNGKREGGTGTEVEAEGVGEGEGEEVVGPDIWLCPTARSLVGKEKGRKD
ncbi:MAG: hypothetical protein Q9187_004443 [Circinaria calcarea]